MSLAVFERSAVSSWQNIIVSTYRHKGAKSVASDATLARIGAFPVLIKTDYIGSLERLDFAPLGGHATARRIGHITVEVIIYEDHFLDTIEPCFRVFIFRHIRRYARTF